MGEGPTEPHKNDRAAAEPTGHPTERRFTVGEAAELLGITAEAVRSRIKRKTLRSTKDGSTVYVLLEGGQTATGRDQTDARTTPEPDQTDDRAELVDVLRDQVEYLRDQLGEEREARRRADMLLARLTEANATLAGQVRELTAPTGTPHGPQGGAEASEGADGPEAPTDAHTDAQGPEGLDKQTDLTTRRPWWLRWLGG
jgi:excisionase family DNA binding protein